MATTGNSSDYCGKPGCGRAPEETYEGTNGNTVRVCGMHYYKLVTSDTAELSPLGLGTDFTGGESVSITHDDDKTVTHSFVGDAIR